MNVNTVVVGVDGSECAQRALDAALEITEAGGTVHVVSAYDAPSNHRVALAFASVPEEYKRDIDLLAEPRAIVERAAKSVADQGFNAVQHLIDNDPASAILSTAEETNADMIVVGSRGLGRASQVVRGSISTKIAHHSPVDFMVIH